MITDFCHNIDECDDNLSEKLENFNDAVTHLLGWRDRMSRFLEYINVKLWLCIILIALLSCSIAIFCDFFAAKLLNSRLALVRTFDRFDIQIGLWVMSSIVLALIATSFCGILSTDAQGSGIPDVKTIISGINFYKSLTIKTLIAKVFGMCFIQAAGFLIGFQGPIIHVSAIVANNVMKLPIFREFDRSNFHRRQILTASVACGVVCTFGTPYGGVLFSVELCSSIYLISNLFKTYVCGIVAYELFQHVHQFEGFFDDYKNEPLQNKKGDSSFHFIVLGIILGYLGSFVIYVAGKLVQLKNSSDFEVFKNRYLFIPLAAFFIAAITYFEDNFWYGNRQIMIDLFNRESLTSEQASGMWKSDHMALLLFSSFVIRAIVMFVMLCSPIPNGVFAPSVIMGGLIGRLYAEVGNIYFEANLNRRVCAVAGAGAFAGILTKTTSPILIMLELTEEMSYLKGLVLTTLIGNAIVGVYTMSLFDTLLNIRKLPFLPVLYSSLWYKRIAAEIMQPTKYVIHKQANLIDLLAILAEDPEINKENYIPVVESLENPVLIGSFTFNSALEYLFAECADIESKVKTGTSHTNYSLKKYLNSLQMQQGAEVHNTGDSTVIKIGDDLRKYLQSLITLQTKYAYDKDGKIVEEKKLLGGESGVYLNMGRNKTVASVIEEIKQESEKKKRYDREHKGVSNTGMRLSKRSLRGNPEEVFQYFRQVIFKKQIDLSHPALRCNSFPTTVRVDTKLVKVHYIFQMLGTSWIFVRGEKEHLKGYISKQAFLNLRYSLNTC